MIVWHQEALVDFDELVARYAEMRSGLGEALVRAMAYLLDMIDWSPGVWPVAPPTSLRKAILPPPFDKLLCFYSAELRLVVAVVDGRSDPLVIARMLRRRAR